jgi:hypothetical protein
VKVLELRIHGIGPHSPWSALGRPEVTRRLLPPDIVHNLAGRQDRLETSVPPVVPAHHVELVNWSKSSRQNTRLLWYIALPFTLVNVAVQMQSAGSDRWSRTGNIVLRVGGHVAALATSLLATVWAMTLAENLLFIHFGGSLMVQKAVCGGVVFLLAAGTIMRMMVRPGNTTRFATTMTHAFVITVFGGACLVLRPAQWAAPPAPLDWAGTNVPGASGGTVGKLDFVTAVSAAATALCLLVGLALVVCQAGESRAAARTAGAPAAANFATAGLLISVSPVLLCAIGSVLRTASGFLVRLVQYFCGRASINLAQPISGRSAIVRPPNYPHLNRHYNLDRISLVSLATLTAVALALGLLIAFHPRGPRSLPKADDFGPVTLVHRTCGTLRQTTIWVLPLTLALTAAAFAFSVAFDLPVAIRWRLLATEIAVDGIIFVVAVLALGGFPRLRIGISFIADLACFWPPTVHPLGGTTYRPSVCAGLAEIVEDAQPDVLVLVGHSQGSVIAAWFLAEQTRSPARRTHLVTCGSPLTSLYATFFPAQFSPDFFRRARAATSSWDNFWRGTDPIALPLNPSAGTDGSDDHHLCDPATPGRSPCGHADYWVDSCQSTVIAERIAASSVDLTTRADADPTLVATAT